MKIDCPSCGFEVSLDHKIFQDYEGPFKCFCCGMISEIRAEGGIINAVSSLDILPGHSRNSAIEPVS